MYVARCQFHLVSEHHLQGTPHYSFRQARSAWIHGIDHVEDGSAPDSFCVIRPLPRPRCPGVSYDNSKINDIGDRRAKLSM